jgi:hypothetical protein
MTWSSLSERVEQRREDERQQHQQADPANPGPRLPAGQITTQLEPRAVAVSLHRRRIRFKVALSSAGA